MQAHNRSAVSRRSSRVPVAVPLLVTSLDPASDFSEVCETLVVSAHGCAMRSPMQVKTGIPVHFHTKQGRQMMAHIVDCQPVGSTPQAWTLAAQLDEPDNLWDLNPCPEDWVRAGEQKPAPSAQAVAGVGENSLPSQASGGAPENRQSQLSKDQLQAMIATFLQPLQAELAALREKLAQRETQRSRFEVSLSQIPPELEQQLWARLRQELEPRALQLTRQESERLLGAAHDAIKEKISQTQGELRQHASEELQRVTQRAQAWSEQAAQALQQQFRVHTEQLQQHIAGEQTRLKEQSEELGRALRQQLIEEHRLQRQEMQQAQDAFTAQNSSVKSQLAEIDGRLAKLDESARRLEADLVAHVAAVAGELVSRATTQLESTAESLLNQVQTSNKQALELQLHQARERLTNLESEIQNSLSQAMQAQILQAVEEFEGRMHGLAEQCIGHWRSALASQLNSFAGMLGEQLPLHVSSSRAGE